MSIVSFCCPWLKTGIKSNFEPTFELYVKLFVFLNRISAKIFSQTQFYSDTKTQRIKKTLYIISLLSC